MSLYLPFTMLLIFKCCPLFIYPRQTCAPFSEGIRASAGIQLGIESMYANHSSRSGLQRTAAELAAGAPANARVRPVHS